MPFDAGAVEGHLELDAKGFVDSLNRARKSLDSLTKTNKRAGSSMLTFSKALGTVRDAVIVLPALFKAVTAPIRGLFNQLKAASGVAAEFQLTTRKLTTALALSGQTGAAEITTRLQAFADTMQEATGISNTMTLGVAQTLTVLGVQQDQLEDATTAVLNYSEAMGRDANMAALQFGRTLSGLIGELGEALPAVRDLTQEQLQAGKAFEVAGELFAGTAEQVAKTTTGIRRGLASAFGDFQRAIGDTINPVLDAITKGMTRALEALTGLVRAHESELRSAFADMAKGALQAVRAAFDFALDVPALLAKAKAFVFDLVASFKVGGADIEVTALRIIERVQVALSDMFMSLKGLPILGSDFENAAHQMLAAASETQEEISRSTSALREQTEELAKGSREAEELATRAQEAADAIRDGSDTTSAWAQAFNRVNEAIDTTESGLNNVNAAAEKVNINVNSAGQSARKSIEIWKRVGREIDEAKEGAGSLAASTDKARDSTAALASEAERAANGFNAAASAASSMEQAATATAGETRRAGGRAGLNLDDPFAATEAAQAAAASINQARFGLFGVSQARSARAVTNQITAAAQGAVDKAIADFTNDLISELNRAGVFDPTERKTYINDRIAEAQRFGVLPSSQVSSFATGI